MKVTTTHLTKRLLQELSVGRTHTDFKRWQETLAALESFKTGRVVEGEEVDTWLASWGK